MNHPKQRHLREHKFALPGGIRCPRPPGPPQRVKCPNMHLRSGCRLRSLLKQKGRKPRPAELFDEVHSSAQTSALHVPKFSEPAQSTDVHTTRQSTQRRQHFFTRTATPALFYVHTAQASQASKRAARRRQSRQRSAGGAPVPPDDSCQSPAVAAAWVAAVHLCAACVNGGTA